MMTTARLSRLALGLALAASALSAAACTGPARSPQHNEDLAITHIEGDEYDQMMAVAGLEGPRAAEFEEAVAERHAVMEKLEDGQLARARDVAKDALDSAKKTDDKEAIEAARKSYREATENYWQARSDLRADVMAHLTLDEQRDWAGYVLYHKVIGRLKEMELTEDQKRQARHVCNMVATDVVGPNTVEKDPYLKVLNKDEVKDRAARRIRDAVLTPQQKETCDRMKIFD